MIKLLQGKESDVGCWTHCLLFFAKTSRLRVQTKWLWGSNPVPVTQTSDIAPALTKEFLDIQATTECRFTLKHVRGTIRTYGQIFFLLFFFVLLFIVQSWYYKYYSHIVYLQYTNTSRLNIFLEISPKIINNNNNKKSFIIYLNEIYTYKIDLNKIKKNMRLFSLRNLLSQKFYKNLKFCWKFWHNLHAHLSQCQFFIFNLKSCKEVASLYSLGRFAQRNGVLFDIASILYFTVFLFSLDVSWKFLTLCVFSRNIKSFP